MKQIVVILLIFLCELGDLSKHDRYVDDVNKRRKEFAKKFKIKNMKNLTWDDALRSKAEDMCDSCGKSRYNDNSRHYYIFYKESKDAVKNYTAYFDGMFDTGKFKEMVDYLNESPKPRINILELYVPTQNKIACSNCLTCPLKLGSLEIKRHVWCLIGPNGNISFSDFVFETSTTTTKLPSTKNGEVFISSGSEAANTTGSVPSTTVTSTTHSTSTSLSSTPLTSTSHSPSTLTTSLNTTKVNGSTGVSTSRSPAKSTNVFTSRSPAKPTNLPPMEMILDEDYPKDTTDPIDDIEDSSPPKVSFILFMIFIFLFL